MIQLDHNVVDFRAGSSRVHHRCGILRATKDELSPGRCLNEGKKIFLQLRFKGAMISKAREGCGQGLSGGKDGPP